MTYTRTGRGLLATITLVSTLAACNQPPQVIDSLNQDNAMAQANSLKAPEQPTPVAPRVPYSAQWHGQTLSDPYHWLKDQGYPSIDDEPVLAYLNQENAYFDAFIKPQETLVNNLFEEMKGRLDETEESVPYVDNGYEYRWYYREGANYPTYARKPVGSDEEVVFLDQQALSEGTEYFVLGDWEISPDNKLLAYSVDTKGSERYTITLVNLESGEKQEAIIEDANGNIEFSADNRAIVYGRLNPNRWRVDDVVAYDLENQTAKVLFNEPDDEYFIGFNITSDKAFLLISLSKGSISEYHAVPTSDIYAQPKMLASRTEAFDYSVDHAHGKFYILANDSHVNFRLAAVDDSAPELANWKSLIEGSDERYLQGLRTFDKFMVIQQSENAYEQLVVRDYQGESHPIEFPEKMISVYMTGNYDFGQNHVRINYESFLTPDTVFDYDIAARSFATRKVKAIPSGYDKNLYQTERLMASVRDGTLVPISLMYKKGTVLDGSAPLHMTGYGAYGSGYPTSFSTNRLSLVDRGVIFAVAHVRGGDDMGYQWYLDGKLDKRKNTFNDFVDSAKYLIDNNYVRAKNLSISGGSAGGELVGAALVQAPELWSSVLLKVPFVDVLNTMLDASLPLTPPEWTQWGNPIESKAYYDYILSYSPYDHIEAREYPPMMLTGGLNDPRVTYWEPAKFAAKMRHLKTDNNLMVMRINMGAGHFANSGRYGRLKDYAQEYAFSLLSHGITE